MPTANVDYVYVCRTHRVPTFPWLFPSPCITSVIFLHNLRNLLQSLSSFSSFLHFYLPQTPKPIHFLKAYDKSYSTMNKEHKYKDKDNDKDKDAKGMTETIAV